MATHSKTKFNLDLAIGGVSLGQLVILAKSLAVMINSAVPITEALEIASDSQGGNLRKILLQVLQSVMAGRSLTDALAKPAPLNFLNILPESSKTLTPLLPVRKRIARSSESERRSGPYFSSFSLGLSTFGKSFIFIFIFQFSNHPSL